MSKLFPFILLLSLQIATVAHPKVAAVHGVLDLHNLQGDLREVSLTGEWAFYWQQLIDPGQFETVHPDVYGKVPAYWTSYHDSVAGITGKGYATYRLLVLMPSQFNDSIALRIPVFDTSYELFLNGDKVAGNGKIGTSEETSSPSYVPRIYRFENPGDTMELVIHVANFSHRRGGFWMDMKMGEADPMLKKNERKKVINYALLGILFGTFILFLVFYLFEKERWSFLYFSLAALGMFLRLVNTGFYPGNFMIDQSWIWTVRMEYIGSYIALSFGALYLDQFFKSRRMHKIVVANALLFGIFALVTLFTKPAVFGYGVYFLFSWGIFFLSFYIYRSFSGMLRLKHPSTVFFFSMLIILLAAVNDTLVSFSMSPFHSEYLLPLSFLLFILVQVSILIEQWISTYKEKISIHEELEYVNHNLENIINERTHELEISNKELKESLEMKEKTFSIIAHDLRSPVASLVQYSDLMLEKFSDSENARIITELQRLSSASLDLIENLLHWGRQQHRNINYHPETVQLAEIINDSLLLMRHPLKEKEINLQVEVPVDLKAWCDSTLLHICIRNLLSNAVKFTPVNGTITVMASADEDTVAVTVQDSGIGIEKERLSKILSENSESTPGTSGERGTGLGLVVVKEMTKINKGALVIESKPGRGTSAKFTLPGKP